MEKRNEMLFLHLTMLLFSSMGFSERCLPLINPVWSLCIKVVITASNLADSVSLHCNDIGQKLAHCVKFLFGFGMFYKEQPCKYYNKIIKLTLFSFEMLCAES